MMTLELGYKYTQYVKGLFSIAALDGMSFGTTS